jgi:hypothetical protein
MTGLKFFLSDSFVENISKEIKYRPVSFRVADDVAAASGRVRLEGEHFEVGREAAAELDGVGLLREHFVDARHRLPRKKISLLILFRLYTKQYPSFLNDVRSMLHMIAIFRDFANCRQKICRFSQIPMLLLNYLKKLAAV